MFNSKLVLNHSISDTVVKTFVRNRQIDGESQYVDLGSVGSSNIMANLLKVRATETGSAVKPDTHRRTHNLNRELVMLGADLKPYKAMVNFTITFPGGNVVSTAALKSMTEDIFILVTALESANTAPGGNYNENLSEEYFTSVLTTQV